MSDGSYPDPVVAVETLTPAVLYDTLAAEEPLSILDVRNRDAFEQWHLEGPHVDIEHVPYIRFAEASVAGSVSERFETTGLAEPVLVVCARGESSAYVASLLERAGFDAANLEGGMEAWADFTVTRSVPTAATARIEQIIRPSSGCVSYVVVSEDSGIVFDPLRALLDETHAVARRMDADLEVAVDTHVHADHVSGLREHVREDGVTGFIPEGALQRGYDATGIGSLQDDDRIEIGDTSVRAIEAPGHTSELVVFRLEDVLFSADCLFLNGVGRPDLEAGSDGARRLAQDLHRTLHHRLATLPDSLTVAPGHLDVTKFPVTGVPAVADLGTLRARIAAFGRDVDPFVDAILTDVPSRPANYQEIIEINLGRREVDAETAAELELGPNNCAVSTAD